MLAAPYTQAIQRRFDEESLLRPFCDSAGHQGPDSNSSAILLLFIIHLFSSSLPLSSGFGKNSSANMCLPAATLSGRDFAVKEIFYFLVSTPLFRGGFMTVAYNPWGL